MKVLLCTLSVQHVPNLLSVHHVQPDWLVLLETQSMRLQQKSTLFLRALALGGLDYDSRCIVISIDQEDAVDRLRSGLDVVCRKFNPSVWVVNLTGGTKWLCLALYDYFLPRQAQFLYTPIEQPTRFWFVGSQKKEEGQYRLSLAEFITGYGFVPQNAARPSCTGSFQLATQIACHANENGLLRLRDSTLWDTARKTGHSLQPGEVKPYHESIRVALEQEFHLQHDKEGHLLGKLSAEAVQFLSGGWLEVFFIGLLQHHAQALGVWDVQGNLTIASRGPQRIYNELDIAFLYQHSLWIIECKSGGQHHDKEADILYKIEAISQQFKALRVQTILATTSPWILNKGSVKPHIANRAAMYHCRILPAVQIRKLAAQADNPKVVQDSLFGTSEREIK